MLDDLERHARRIQGLCFDANMEGGFVWAGDTPVPMRRFLMRFSRQILEHVERIRKEQECE